MKFIKKENEKKQLNRLIKYYSIYIIIAIITYVSSSVIYNSNNTYKEYMKYNNDRATLHDITYVDYEENKEIFDEIGWSKNDHYMFYTFGFGDENIFSKEKIQKVLDYKIKKDGKYNFNTDLIQIKYNFISETTNTYTYISILFISMFILSFFINKKRNGFNILIFIITFSLHVLFLIIGRSMLRVVIPEYIIRNSFIDL